MDIGDTMMTTLIDDGLVESCLDDSITVVDFDQLPIIDIDNIDATIEDPGYILDVAPDTFNRNEEYTSSYKKQSFALPVTFFDISKNITLLKKCRPISIKIVDCDIYPWYYKKIKHIIKNKNVISNKDEVSKQYKVSYSTTDLVSSIYPHLEDSVCSTFPTSYPTIDLTSEQRSVVLNSKENIDNKVYLNEVNENTLNEVDTEATLNNDKDLPLLNKSTPECSFNKSVEPVDLLTYKAIAETIVRTIDQSEGKTKTDSVNSCVQNPNISRISEKGILVNVDHSDINKTGKKINSCVQNPNISRICEKGISVNVDHSDINKTGKKICETEKILTSPILPYKIKPQKKTKPYEKALGSSSNNNTILEKCSDSHKIPHYHRRLPVSANNNNFYLTTMIANQNNFQKPITKNMPLYLPQPLNRNGILSGNCDSTSSTHHSVERFVSSANSTGGISYVGINKNSNNSFTMNSQVNKMQIIENMNPNIHSPIFDHQFHSSSLLSHQNTINAVSGYNEVSGYPKQAKVMNDYSLPLVRLPSPKQVSKENYSVYSQVSTFDNVTYDNDTPNSPRLLNEHVICSRAQIPLQRTVNNMTNIIQTNPLLSHILNSNNLNEYYQSKLEQHGGLHPKTAVGGIPHPPTRQNFWLPPRHPRRSPLPSCSSYGDYLFSSQFHRDKNLKHSNAGIHLHRFPNSLDTYLQNKTKLNPNNSDNNPGEQLKDNNNLIDLPNVTISMTSKIESMKPNIFPRTIMENKNKILSGSRGVTDPKKLININGVVNNQNIINISTVSAKNNNIKVSQKNNFDAMINVLSNEKSNCIHSKVHTHNVITKNKILLSNKNPVEQYGTTIPIKLNTKLKIGEVLNRPYDCVLQPTRDITVAPSEQAETKTHGYSQPILPIPTFKKSLELLSELQRSPALNSTENKCFETKVHNNRCDTSMPRTKNQIYSNITRKRKLNNDQKMCISNKRISLQEYKIRRPENVITIM